MWVFGYWRLASVLRNKICQALPLQVALRHYGFDSEGRPFDADFRIIKADGFGTFWNKWRRHPDADMSFIFQDHKTVREVTWHKQGISCLFA